MSSVIVVIAGVAIVVYTIGSQIRGTAIRAKRLIVLPGIVTVIGAVNLSTKSVHPSGTDIALIVVGSLIAAAIGLALGAMMRLEERDGWLWGQLPKRGLWLWLAFFASRGVLIGIASGVDAHVASGTHAELLILGINRLGQAAVVGLRAYLSETPFAPERDGSRPFGTLFADQTSSADSFPGQPRPTPDASAPGAQTGIGAGQRGGRLTGLLSGATGPAVDSRRTARRARRGRR